MKKNKQLFINLQAAKITKMKQAGLQAAVNNALPKTAKKEKPAVKKTSGDVSSTNNAKPVAVAAPALQTANLQVVFRNVDAGLSDFTATCNGTSQTIHESGSICFNQIKTGDTIMINGDSAGTTDVTITGVNALPMQMHFDEGQHINGIFLIVP
jgi:hypothetical protein